MANGKDHARIGVLAGGFTAAGYARHQPTANLLLETVGGVGGGWLGAKIPDILDPPTSGRHRSIGHGVGPASTLAIKYAKALPALQESLRTEAQRQQVFADASDGVLQQLWHALLALLCVLGAGALAGLLGGFVSHLALDARTPMGLPVIA